jgi:predicted dehydrogenase
MKTKSKNLNRRQFLKLTATGTSVTAIGFPIIIPSRVLGAEAPSKLIQIAQIGCGRIAQEMDLPGVLKHPRLARIVALADFDSKRAELARRRIEQSYEKSLSQKVAVKTYGDYREIIARQDIDAVLISTPDHWHAQPVLKAALTGKDIYVQKPLSMTIAEGRLVSDVVRSRKRVLQIGSQQRSTAQFHHACELVRNGRIGKLKHISVFLPSGRREGPFRPSPVPAGFNWDMWQGQTHNVDYVKERTHVTFRYWWEYSGGTMTDWGAHHNDIALWGAGLERSGPVEVEGKALVQMIPDGFSAASEYDVRYTYANGVTHNCQSTPADAWNGAVVNKDGQHHGVKFEGSDGWIWVTRGKIEASTPEFLTQPLAASAERLYVSNNHMGNFFDCVRSRKPAICEAEIGHRSASVCHLGTIAIRLGRKLKWDPKQEQFVGDKEANNLLAREMRKPWSYDAV